MPYKFERIDYSKLSLAEIVERKAKTDVPFQKLPQEERQKILRFLRLNAIGKKVFDHKWYDVLSGKFYAEEYIIADDPKDCDTREKSFDSLDEYYEYVDGDVYENACYYGYRFSDEEISKYSLDLERMNFDSFEKETISSWEAPPELKFDAVSAANRAREMFNWMNACPQVTNPEQLEESHKAFTSRFGEDWGRLFLTTILRRDKETIEEAAIDWLCKKGPQGGISFGDILFPLGWDAALKMIETYRASGGIERVAKTLEMAMVDSNDGSLKRERALGFSFYKQLYFVVDEYPRFYGGYLDVSNWFLGFDEFASFVDGDLRRADLKAAPVPKEEVLAYKTDSLTQFPMEAGPAKSRTFKKYDGHFFCVRKAWLNGYGDLIHAERRWFRRFFDFAHFLEGNLSAANLVLCDGVENLSSVPGLKFERAKVRSVAAEALGLPLNPPPAERLKTENFETSEKNELETKEGFLVARPDDEEYSVDIGYVSDIHLQHRFVAHGCKTIEDIAYVIDVIAKAIAHEHGRGFGFNLIGGDTSSDFETFRSFVSKLYGEGNYQRYFFVLGNHELWSFPGRPFDEIVAAYRNALPEMGEGPMRLVQNNLFYHADYSWHELTENELSSIGESELRERTRGADQIIFGGLGFAGANEDFNANSGIYLNTIDREQEIELSSRFFALYKKVASALKGRQVIVLTHMPMSDWGGKDLKPEDGFIYVNGHSHRNYFFDDGKTRVFADNQIGYKGKAVSMKKIPVDFGFDWFADYPDGIHEITRGDYSEYYRGIGEHMSFNRDFAKLYLLKRDSVYMFLRLDAKGKLKLLCGGVPKNVGDHDLDYFYERMTNYARSVHLYLSRYDAFQKQVSSEVRRIGGSGKIHGAIVDIDFFNHLYLNCFDGSITPYSASSIVDKYVYKNLGSLLRYERPELYKKYEELVSKDGDQGALVVRKENLPISNKTTRVTDTGMYSVSRLLKSLQFTTKYNLIRVWSDSLADESSEENGKQIVTALLENIK